MASLSMRFSVSHPAPWLTGLNQVEFDRLRYHRLRRLFLSAVSRARCYVTIDCPPALLGRVLMTMRDGAIF